MQSDGSSTFVQDLVRLLCEKLSGHSGDVVSELFKGVLVTLSSNISPFFTGNEVDLAERIKRKLAQSRNDKVAADFSELFRKLQAQTALSDRWSILYLLYKLSNFNKTKSSAKVCELSGFISSTPITHGGVVHASLSTINATRNINSSRGFFMENVSTVSDISSILSHIKASKISDFDASGDKKSSHTTQPTGFLKYNSNKTCPSGTSPCSFEYLADILKDIIYVLQGIDGKFIVYDEENELYKIKSGVEISKSAGLLVSRLSECGFLHNKIRKYMDERASEQIHGLVAQSFCSALHQELTEYYRLVANLEAQIQQEDMKIPGQVTQSLTLRRMLVWLNEPLHRLTIMASLVDVCRGKKGGELASAIHSFTKHGDPNIQTLTKKILSLVVHPIFNFIVRWIYDGELEDPFQEFFVASDAKVKDERLWIDKYSLRNNMIPSFMTSDQARKILLTGKTISFLRQVCSDRTLIKDRDIVRAANTNEVEVMFSQGQDGSFAKMINVIYKETSSYLLKVLYERYKFMDHLKAMRKYLLLGQGDFIRHLMDLLEEDLAKPAHTLFLHNLTGTLESAIRATNVQYDDPDIVRRLDVSPGDTGWMVFSLKYHVPDHIGMVFTPESMISYLKVSNFLWSAKRMEYILSVIWREQMTHARIFRPYPEFSPFLHTCHLVASEMLHFVQQIQYYINFEVLECSWVELMMKVEEAGDLDQVISAHKEFLNSITSRSLLDPQLKDIVTRLRTIFDLVIKFQEIQSLIYNKMMQEVEMRRKFESQKESRASKGEWATNSKLEEGEKKRKNEFLQNFIRTIFSDLKMIRRDYKNKVEEFLSLVSQLLDVSLRCLIFRLNFNEHYHMQPHSGRSSNIFIPTSAIQPKKKVK